MTKEERDDNFEHYPQLVAVPAFLAIMLGICHIAATVFGDEPTFFQGLAIAPFMLLFFAIFMAITNDIYCEFFKEKKHDN